MRKAIYCCRETCGPEGQRKRKKNRTTMLRFAVTLLAVITSSTCQKYGCLEGDTHKLKPSPEPKMHECTLYSKSSCCYADFTEQLAHSPVIKVNNSYWNRCGQLSKSKTHGLRSLWKAYTKRAEICMETFVQSSAGCGNCSARVCTQCQRNGCEDFTKKIECFYRCSPHAAHWINRNNAAAIQSVPLCQSFCDDWYEACKDDSTCVRNWLTDWEWDESGENICKNKCISYSEMYANGTDMCQNMWGQSFKVSESSCLCLQMNKKDMVAMKYLVSESSEESSSTSSSASSSEEYACQKKLRKFEKLQREKGEQTR